MKKIIITIVLCVCAIFSAVAQISTSSLRGVVLASDGDALVGATLLLEHPASGVSYTAVSDADGRFAIHGVRPGDGYRLTVEYLGYMTSRRESVVLRLGEVRSERIVLKESATSVGEVVVEASPVKMSGVVRDFDEQTISLLPSVSRSLYDVVRLTPQAIATKTGGMSYGGVANRYNAFRVNGVANNDMYGLSSSGTNGGLSNANPVSLDAIEQIEVSVAPFDVRMSGFGGGEINAITKTGTNEFRGSAYTYYNNQDFYGTTAGRDVEKREKLAEQATQVYGVTLGGPIVKDKLFFFLSGEYNRESSPSSYYEGFAGARLNTEELRRISERYESLTGYNGGGVKGRDVEQRAVSLMAALDWYIDSRNHLSVSYSLLDARAEEYGNSLTSFTFCGSGYANYSTAHHVAITLNSRISEHLHNALRVGYSRVGDGREGDVKGAFPSVIIKNTGLDGNVTVNIGNNRYAGVNALSQDVLTVADDLTWEYKAHSFTFGTHNEFYNIHNRYLANAFGTYTYNSVADFERDMAAMYEYNYTDPAVTGTTQWGPRFKAAEINLYAQDNWDLGRGLTLTYGVRATLPLIFNTPTPNDEFNGGEIAKRYGIRIGDVPRAHLLLSPRVGLSWEKSYAVGRLSVEGGVGIFTGQVPFVWVVNNYSNTGVEQKGLRLTGAFENGEVVGSAAPFTPTPEPTTLSNTSFMLNAMDDEFRYPQNLKASLSGEFVWNNGWSVRGDVLYTKTLQNVRFRNLAIERTADVIYAVPSADGELSSGIYPAFTRTTNDYSAIYYMENTSKGYSYVISGSVSKIFPFGLSLAASYAYAGAYAVCDIPSTSSSTNWTRGYGVDLNAEEMGISAYNVPHKLSVMATYRKRYAPLFDVAASLVYQLQSGQRYSLCFGETVDFNGDGVFGSTLMYIPTEEELGRMTFADDKSASRWNDFINDSEYLRSHRGSFAERNAMQTPVEHRLDLHLSHGFYFGRTTGRKLELSLDVMNLGNLICRHWGSYYNVSGWRQQPVNIVRMEDNTPVYQFTNATILPSDLLSRWHMQLGVRVVF